MTEETAVATAAAASFGVGVVAAGGEGVIHAETGAEADDLGLGQLGRDLVIALASFAE